MRYILPLIMILMLVIPANAVTVTCVNEGNNIVRVDYDAAGEAALPIAFALDITVDNGATIQRIYDFKVGDSNAASPGFGIFPRNITFNESGEIIDWGSPDVNDASAATLPGVGTSGVTLEMAARYSGAANAPLVKGTLCRLAVAAGTVQTVNVKVAANVKGGGAVLEDAAVAKFTGIGCALGTSTPPPPEPNTIQAPLSISYPTTSNTGKYSVNWSASTGATSYQLERSNNAGSTWTQIYSGANPSRSETVTNGSYRYRVKAANTAGSSSWTTGTSDCVVSISSSTTAPQAPAKINYPTTSSTGQYTVSWTASTGAVSYRLDRSVNGGSWQQIYSGSNISYAEKVAKGSYRYRVRASNKAGTSKWTTGSWNCAVSISSSTATPSVPAKITYPTSSKSGRYTISWPASNGAASYQLERSANEGKAPWIRIYSGAALSWSENITDGKYRYRVRATNSAGSSNWRTGTNYCEVHIED